MELRNRTLYEALTETAAKYPDNTAVSHKNRRSTYAEFAAQADLASAAFSGAGIRRGTLAAVWMNSTPEALACFFGLWKLGAVVIPVSASYLENDIQKMLDSVFPEYVICDGGKRGFGSRAILERLHYAGKIICLDSQAKAENYFAEPKKDGAIQTEKVLSSDPDTFLLTSGSSSKVKVVMSTHFSRSNLMVSQAEGLQLTEQDRICMCLPVCHCFGLTGTALAGISAGSCLCFPENRSPEAILETILSERCTVLNAVPTMFSNLIRLVRERNADTSFIRTGIMAGSSYSSTLFKQSEQILGLRLMASLGQTEATAGYTTTTFTDPQEVRVMTVGKPFPHITCSVFNATENRLCVPGETGEILVSGYTVMQGYYRDPERTAEVIDGKGRLHTGDLGYISSDGNLVYFGRKKSIIIRGGVNISPREIEELLAEVPGIRNAAVLGVPDPHYVETICACIIADSVSEEDIRAYMEKHVAHIKIPQYVLYFREFPVFENGKIDMPSLKKMALHMIEKGITEYEEHQ